MGPLEAAAIDDFQRARVDLVRGHVAFASGLGSDAPRSLLKAATHLNEVNPFMRPGIKIITGPTNYYPISKAQLLRYDHDHWVAAAPLASARG